MAKGIAVPVYALQQIGNNLDPGVRMRADTMDRRHHRPAMIEKGGGTNRINGVR